MTNISIENCQTLPSPDDLNGILGNYYALIVQRMREMGFDIPLAAPESALAEFWAQSDAYLPPNGCLLIARADNGEVLACGILKRLVADTLTPNIEMRTLYPKMGFVELDTPLETTTYKDQAMLRGQMHFFEKML